MARIVGSNDTRGPLPLLTTHRNPNIRSSIIVQCECVQHISKISRCLRAPSGGAHLRVLGGGLCKVRGRARQQHACRTPVLFSKRFELNCLLFCYNLFIFHTSSLEVPDKSGSLHVQERWHPLRPLCLQVFSSFKLYTLLSKLNYFLKMLSFSAPK